MDPISGLLDHPRARGVFTLRVVMAPPWSIDVRDGAALTLVVVLRGSARLRAGGRCTVLGRGDVALVRGPEPYVVEHLDVGGTGSTDGAGSTVGAADAEGTVGDRDDAVGAGGPDETGASRGSVPAARVTEVVIGPDQSCSTPDGADLQLALSHGTRTWGNVAEGTEGAEGADALLVATYAGTGEVGRLVTEALPRVAHVPAAPEAGGVVAGGSQTGGVPGAPGPDRSLVDLLAREVTGDGLGQGTVLDRLVDVVLVTTVRAWLAAHPEEAPGWLSTAHDPVVGAALRALHDHPARGWTVASLAHEANVSRATLAARFRAQVGSPPMAYLTRWRLTLAADLLTTTDRTIASIAGDVGYGSPFALSAAFTQHTGTSPGRFRRRHAEAATPG